MFSIEERVLEAIKEAIEKTNSFVYEKSLENEENAGMGTTTILTIVCAKQLFIGHVGDSRMYLIREGQIERITTDHSYIEELIKNGSLTREEAVNHPKRNIITQAIGYAEDIQVDLYTCSISNEDKFLLCTDGLTNMVEESEIVRMIDSQKSYEAISEDLVASANEKGGEDNITVIVFGECLQ